MTDQIRVFTTYSVMYCELPKDIADLVKAVSDEWENDGSIGFDLVLEHYFERIGSEGESKYQTILKFMKENDLEDTYMIDLDW